MIEPWFDPRGSIQRSRFVFDSIVVWLVGHLAFIVFFLTTTPSLSFAGLGGVLDHPGRALETMSHVAGTPWALFAFALWSAYVWAFAALSSKRLQDLGVSGWWAFLTLVPGVQVLLWLALCAWPSGWRQGVQAA